MEFKRMSMPNPLAARLSQVGHLPGIIFVNIPLTQLLRDIHPGDAAEPNRKTVALGGNCDQRLIDNF
jgi:hypothetical protein